MDLNHHTMSMGPAVKPLKCQMSIDKRGWGKHETDQETRIWVECTYLKLVHRHRHAVGPGPGQRLHRPAVPGRARDRIYKQQLIIHDTSDKDKDKEFS
jgi:hypothetical protein